MPKPDCRYILKPATVGCPAIYCEKEVQFTMETQDWGGKIRKYKPFCPACAEKVAKKRAQEELDGYPDSYCD